MEVKKALMEATMDDMQPQSNTNKDLKDLLGVLSGPTGWHTDLQRLIKTGQVEAAIKAIDSLREGNSGYIDISGMDVQEIVDKIKTTNELPS